MQSAARLQPMASISITEQQRRWLDGNAQALGYQSPDAYLQSLLDAARKWQATNHREASEAFRSREEDLDAGGAFCIEDLERALRSKYQSPR